MLAIPTMFLLVALCVIAFGGGGEQKPKEFRVYPIGYVSR